MYQSISSREKKLLLLMVMVIMLSGFYVFLLSPQLDSYTESADKLKQVQEQLRKDEATIRSRQEEEKKFAEYQLKWKNYIAKFDTEYRQGSALVLIGLKAANLGVTINKLVPGGIIDKKDYLELPMVLEVEGEYQSVKQLLNEIETLSNTTEIRALKATALKQELRPQVQDREEPDMTAVDHINVQCDITVYSAPTPSGKLYLEEEKGAAWQIGRDNPFSRPEPVSPYPEIPVPMVIQKQEAVTGDIIEDVPSN